MDTILDAIEQMVKPFDTLNSQVEVNYSGSTMSKPTQHSYDAPYVQHEVITIVLKCRALGIRGSKGIYQLVSDVRKTVLGKRIIAFDPLITGLLEVSSQFTGEESKGYFGHSIVVQTSRPRKIEQSNYA